MKKFSVFALMAMGFVLAPGARGAGQACETLGQLALPNTQITSAESIAAGAFSSPPSMAAWLAGHPSFFKRLPAFCRVIAVSKPSTDSDIKIEIWLPATGWNGKFRGQGNGGFAGEIDYRALGIAISQGYASAGTDTGHAAEDTDARWALGHPEKIVDFGYRAIHEMTTVGKAAVKTFYGDRPRRSYFASCSNGGRQALMEAQRFPEDYDGILAGAPANYWTHLLTTALYNAQATTLDPASYIPASKIPTIAKAVNESCDALDGVTDGILNDPRKCHFDPAVLLCKAADSNACLTQPQVTTLKTLYEGAHDAEGRQIFPGYVPGGEDGGGGWALWITGPGPGKSLLFAFGGGYFADMVYGQSDWDYKKARVDDALKASDEKFAGVLNATDANLKPFESRGGKLIIYHGWSDAAISALNSIHYFENVENKMGKQDADSFLRLYMVPGMQHCGGGPGPNIFGQTGVSPVDDPQHNMYMALEQWVEKGAAPSTVIATNQPEESATAAKMTRPLCAYPEVAKYKGNGDTNDAANFVCAPEK
ncbi:MAG: tannase/feruloyl esterase family alpha/beta hydrolase [Candidatus Acidiferrum sp.]